MPDMRAFAVLAVLGGAAGAQDAATRRDGDGFVAALERTLEGVQEGSAEAKLGIGTIHDLGLGVPPDPAEAFRWYLDAAREGLAEAQFNVAVMLDAGTGVPRDRKGAAVWYARAALGGNDRARYNLGVLYELGEGVDRNTTLSRAWLAEVSPRLDAARERLAAAPPPATGALAAPRPLAAALQEADGTGRADLVWTAAPGPSDVRYVVEIAARLASGGFEPVAHAETALSAASLAVPPDVPLLWRVSAVGAGDYAASPWQSVDGGGSVEGPEGRARFVLPPDDTAALVLAAELSAAFRVAGLMIEPARLDAEAERTGVVHAFPADTGLAVRVASALPGFGPRGVRRDDLAGPVPGLVEVVVVGGPAAD